MRKLKIDENQLKEAIYQVIISHPFGIEIKDLNNELISKGFKVSPQIVRRNLSELFNEKKTEIVIQHGKKNNN